jgi:hypothetical protein
LKQQEEEEEEEEQLEEDKKEYDQQNIHISTKTPSKRIQKSHPPEQIIGNMDTRVETRRKLCSSRQRNLALLSTVEPNSF